jgi:hypothetical protein
MFIVQTQIIIQQISTVNFPNRNNKFVINFAVDIDCSDSWHDFTNNCKITLPKNFKYTSTKGNVFTANTAVYLGGNNDNNTPPLFLRGDEISVSLGYKYKKNGTDFLDTAIAFKGFISKITSKKPFVLECEDNMWKLKQLPAPNKFFSGKIYTLESMLTEMLAGTPYTVNKKSSTKIGDFRTENETVMDVLTRLRKDFHIESYFHETELRSGYLVVYMDAGNTYNFVFQNNIISDELDFQRKDDVILSAIGYSVNYLTESGTTKDGHAKTKKSRFEVLVTLQNGTFTSKITPVGAKANYPPNNTGERRTFYFPNVTSSTDLVNRVKEKLNKYFYTGFKGKFVTFGIPYVRQGDNVNLYDAVMPERNGQYKVKSVHYNLSVSGGLRQTIEVDYQIKTLPAYTQTQIQKFITNGFPK